MIHHETVKFADIPLKNEYITNQAWLQPFHLNYSIIGLILKDLKQMDKFSQHITA